MWGRNRVAVRIGPGGTWNSMSDSNPATLFDYLADQLNRFELAYLHIIEPRIKGNELVVTEQGPVATERLRKIFKGKIIAAGGFEPETAEAIIGKGDADLVAFGRHFVANPDLPKRIRLRQPLSEYDRKTFYTFDFRGYTDYPFYEQQRDGLFSDPFCPQLRNPAFISTTAPTRAALVGRPAPNGGLNRKTRCLSWRPSTRSSTGATTPPPNAFGRLTIFSTVLTSLLAARVSLISSRAYPYTEVRTRNDPGRWRFCICARTIFRHRLASELDCGRHSSNQGGDSGRALGCDSG